MSEINPRGKAVAFGRDELGEPLGDTIACPKCGRQHAAEQVESWKILAHKNRELAKAADALLEEVAAVSDEMRVQKISYLNAGERLDAILAKRK